MLNKNQGYSARRSRRTSRRVENATIGAHAVNRAAARHSRTGADSVNFSDTARSQRAERGQVRTIDPSSTSRTAQELYGHRVGRMQDRYIEQLRRRKRRKRILVVVVVVVLLLAFAVGVGAFVYLRNVGANLALRDSDAQEALSATKAGEPYYVLMSTDLGAVAVPLESAGPDMVLLARVDADAGKVSLVNIPYNLYVSTTDNRRMPLGVLGSESDKMLIEAVERFAEIDISHFVKLDEKGLAGMVDALGGIQLELGEEIDDPHAGNEYIPSGTQTLNGAQALALLRSENLRLGEQARLENQLTFTAEMLARVFESNGTLGFAARLDSIGSFFQTDYSTNELVSLADKLKGITASSIARASVPGYTQADTSAGTSTEVKRYVASADNMHMLIEGIEKGEVPSFDDKPDTSGIDPASFTIQIQNGANISGAASSMRASLEAKGFVVTDIGNTEQAVYTETLVIAKGDNAYLNAQKVIDALGMGRMVEMAYYYEFDDDVLIIIGSDFKPLG